jgi:hypothetical protein
VALIKDQVYGLAATSMALITALGGASRLLGGATSPEPPITVAPNLYLRFEAEVPRAFEVNRWDGEFVWIATDYEHARWVRIRSLWNILRPLYPLVQNQTIWFDSDSGEDVYWLDFLGLSGELAAERPGYVQQEARWGYRKAYRGDFP